VALSHGVAAVAMPQPFLVFDSRRTKTIRDGTQGVPKAEIVNAGDERGVLSSPASKLRKKKNHPPSEGRLWNLEAIEGLGLAFADSIRLHNHDDQRQDSKHGGHRRWQRNNRRDQFVAI
jgi:hypothetical protein